MMLWKHPASLEAEAATMSISSARWISLRIRIFDAINCSCAEELNGIESATGTFFCHPPVFIEQQKYSEIQAY